jgi:hypothetical protein
MLFVDLLPPNKSDKVPDVVIFSAAVLFLLAVVVLPLGLGFKGSIVMFQPRRPGFSTEVELFLTVAFLTPPTLLTDVPLFGTFSPVELLPKRPARPVFVELLFPALLIGLD